MRRTTPTTRVPGVQGELTADTVNSLIGAIRHAGIDGNLLTRTRADLGANSSSPHHLTQDGLLNQSRILAQARNVNMVVEVGTRLGALLMERGKQLRPQQLTEIGRIYTQALEHGREVARVHSRGEESTYNSSRNADAVNRYTEVIEEVRHALYPYTDSPEWQTASHEK